MEIEEAIELVTFGKDNFKENWTPISEESKTYKEVEKIISENNSSVELRAICQVKDGKYYVCSVYGGLNGGGKWTNYFSDLKTIFEKLGDAWLIEMENDCLDDLWSAIFCFRR